MLKAGLIKSSKRKKHRAGRSCVNDAIIDDIGAAVTEADFEDSS